MHDSFKSPNASSQLTVCRQRKADSHFDFVDAFLAELFFAAFFAALFFAVAFLAALTGPPAVKIRSQPDLNLRLDPV
jgi:hypothetical protein